MMIFRDQYQILNTLTSDILSYIHTSNEMHSTACGRMHTCVCAQCLHLREYICVLGLGLHRLFPFVLMLPMYYLIVVFANTLAA